MAEVPLHRCRLIASPWPGVYATEIASGRHFARHAHGTYGLGVVDAGAHRSASGRGTVDAFAGDIVTTNPGEVHDGRPLAVERRSWRTVYIEPQVLAGLAEHGSEVAITRPAFADPQLAQAVRRLLARMEGWAPACAGVKGRAGVAELACEEALVAACGLLLARHSTDAPPRPAPPAPLERVRQRLADDLQDAPRLADLARLAGASRFQLLRRFAAAYGCTPHAWLLQQRAERARSLIRRGLSLGDAAAAAGFADQSHMTRVFTRQFGFTPGAWQRLQ